MWPCDLVIENACALGIIVNDDARIHAHRSYYSTLYRHSFVHSNTVDPTICKLYYLPSYHDIYSIQVHTLWENNVCHACDASTGTTNSDAKLYTKRFFDS